MLYPDLTSYANWKSRGLEFTNDEVSLKVEGSYWTGRERIWIDDQLVIDKRSYGFRSEHDFDHQGDKFKVVFDMKNMLTGDLQIEAARNGKELFSDRKRLYSLRMFIALLLILGAAGYGLGFYVGRTFG
jgi:hypothetical protein